VAESQRRCSDRREPFLKLQTQTVAEIEQNRGLSLVASRLQHTESAAPPIIPKAIQGSRILELDGLRAIAILLVIGCHYEWFASRLRGLPKFGWIGVDIFFVLSGYLITSILLRLKGTAHPFRHFYRRRCQRILPPLALSLLAMALACYLVGDRTFFSARSLVTKVLFLQAFSYPRFLFHPHLHSLARTALRPALTGMEGPMSASALVLWSLSIEEYFYVLWAPVVLLLNRKSIMRLALTICVAELAFRWMYFRGRQDYFSIYHRFDALMYGAIAALLFHRVVSRRWLPRVTAGLSLGLILVRPHED